LANEEFFAKSGKYIVDTIAFILLGSFVYRHLAPAFPPDPRPSHEKIRQAADNYSRVLLSLRYFEDELWLLKPSLVRKAGFSAAKEMRNFIRSNGDLATELTSWGCARMYNRAWEGNEEYLIRQTRRWADKNWVEEEFGWLFDQTMEKPMHISATTISINIWMQRKERPGFWL
jgi:hypothetical protein